jgi:hypothetical protein
VFYFFTRARVVVICARAPFFLSRILTSIETLFAFFCACAFLTYQSWTYPLFCGGKQRGPAVEKLSKKQKLSKTLEKSFLFSFFVSVRFFVM